MQKPKSNAVRAAREASGLSREVAAVKAGVSSTTLRIAEQGGPLSQRTAKALARVLGVEADDLLPRAEARR